MKTALHTGLILQSWHKSARIFALFRFGWKNFNLKLTSWCEIWCSYAYAFTIAVLLLLKLNPNLSWLLVFLLCSNERTNSNHNKTQPYTSLICNHYFTPFPIVRTTLWAFSNTFWATTLKKCVPKTSDLKNNTRSHTCLG